MGNLVLRALHAQRKALLGWSVGLSAYALLIVLTFPSTKGMDFRHIDDNFRFFLGGADTLATFEGWLTSQIFYLPLVLGIYLIVLANRSISSDVRSGRMDFLLSHPLSRAQIVTAKYLALVFILTFLALLFGVALWLTALTIDDRLNLANAMLSGMNLIPITALYFSVAFCLACARAGPQLGVGLASAFAVFGWVLHGLSQTSEAMADIEKWTVFYWYAQGKPFSEGLVVEHVLVLIVSSLLLLGIGVYAFERRDL